MGIGDCRMIVELGTFLSCSRNMSPRCYKTRTSAVPFLRECHLARVNHEGDAPWHFPCVAGRCRSGRGLLPAPRIGRGLAHVEPRGGHPSDRGHGPRETGCAEAVAAGERQASICGGGRSPWVRGARSRTRQSRQDRRPPGRVRVEGDLCDRAGDRRRAKPARPDAEKDDVR